MEKRRVIILENIRSAYNCWNIIRTADSLWWEVWLVGYTPHPEEQSKVKKTSLGAEENVNLKRFDYTKDAIAFARENDFSIFAGEIIDEAVALDAFTKNSEDNSYSHLALILWNEVDGVLDSTLKTVDQVLYIPMKWVKESMNVGQSSAIFMWALQ